ncbi:protein kinase [Streptomyces sp. NPDC050504]|uniref:protein kinase n=1 Tax=Streptomyces sp. NPDC050504 TaxID=3365618 RepID=UPI00379731C2
MDDYAGRVLADRYRLPLPPSDEFELVETRAFDTYSGHEVLVRQVPLPEVVDAEVLDADGASGPVPRRAQGRAMRRATDPAVRRAIEAAQAAAQIPDHDRLDQVFDVFAEHGSLWIVSELVAARPLAALLAERPLNPYRAAEIASDVLTALRVLHAHGWTHRNITARTVLVCDDGRVVLTGLAAGAAEEALCGYVPVPAVEPPGEPGVVGSFGGPGADDETEVLDAVGASDAPDVLDVAVGPGESGAPDVLDVPTHGVPVRGLRAGGPAGALPPGTYGGGGGSGAAGHGDESYGAEEHDETADGEYDAYDGTAEGEYDAYGEAAEDGAYGEAAEDGAYGEPAGTGPSGPAEPPAPPGDDARAARAGAIAAYRAGARAAARGGAGGGFPRPGSPFGEGADAEWTPGRAPGPAPFGFDESVETDAEDDDEATSGGWVQLAGTWQDEPERARPVPSGGGDNPWHGAVPRASAEDGLRAEAQRQRNEQQREQYAQHAQRAEYVRQQRDQQRQQEQYRQEQDQEQGRDRDQGRHQPYGRGTSAALPVPAPVPLPAPSPEPVPVPATRAAGGWDEVVAGEAPRYRGPATRLAAERARQTRIAVVGAVTERWAPEQAGPVHENWRLAPPIGPATDLWALGALLFRAVQGHAPYPEENAAELVQMVCAEPPAYAEECGPLRPVVESLLRQDPDERPDFEELRGWLRSLVRSAPEPDAGVSVVSVPSPDEPVDESTAARLPIVRRRGELVRKRRPGQGGHGRHRQKKERRRERPEREPRAPRTGTTREPRIGARSKGPKSLGRLLLVAILLGLGAAFAYAMLFMPETGDGTAKDGPGQRPAPSTGPSQPGPDATPGSDATPGPQRSTAPTPKPEPKPSAPRTGDAPNLAAGYVLRKDEAGFEVGVDKTFRRGPGTVDRQVRYTGGGFTLLVVPGRDTVQANGSDPMVYQRSKEPELQPFRESSWTTVNGLRTTTSNGRSMAEGQFTWRDADGRDVFVRNAATIIGGKYHIVQVIGPESERDRVTEIYQQAMASYRPAR